MSPTSHGPPGIRQKSIHSRISRKRKTVRRNAFPGFGLGFPMTCLGDAVSVTFYCCDKNITTKATDRRQPTEGRVCLA